MVANSIIGFIIDSFSYDESDLILVIRTLDGVKAIVKVTDFRPMLYVEHNAENMLLLSECVYINKLTDIRLDLQEMSLNACTRKKMIKISVKNKHTMEIMRKSFVKSNVNVYNCNSSVEYQFFSYSNIDPSSVVNIIYTKYNIERSTSVYYTTIGNISNIKDKDMTIFNKIPISVLGFDIEVYSSTGDFPKASNQDDKIVAISYVTFPMNDPSKIQTSILYVNNDTILDKATLDKVELTSQKRFSTERELLVYFVHRLFQSDIIFDFSGTQFDIPYIMSRVSMYNLNFKSYYPLIIMHSKDKSGSGFLLMRGFIHIDVHQVFKSRDAEKNKENNLCFLSSKYLRQDILNINKNTIECKHMFVKVGMTCDITRDILEDIERVQFNGIVEQIDIISDELIRIKFDRDIPELDKSSYISLVKDVFDVTDVYSDFKKMILYCVNDTRLTYGLLNHQNYLMLYLQKSQIRGCLLRDSSTRGNSFLNQNMLTCHMLRENWALKLKSSNVRSYTDDKYEGAKVIDPVAGRHFNIGVLDYNSLYPSIIIAHNICVTTFITEDLLILNNIPRDHVHSLVIEGEPIYFYKREIKQGIIPYYCEMFMNMRTEVKKELETSECKIQRLLLNMKQLNLKVSNNSIYGSIGDGNSTHFNKYIASAVTHYGRKYLNDMIRFFSGYGHDIIGGDTDSIFIKIKCDEENFNDQLNKFNDQLVHPMKIEKEKIYSKLFISTKKKRRFGIITGKKPKLEIKGYMSVKRDTPRMLRDIETKVFDIVINEDYFEDSLLEYVSTLDIENNPFEMYSITKTLKNPKEYLTDNATHVALANKLIKMGIISSINSGDKITYVHICSDAKYVKDRVATIEMMQRDNSIKINYNKYREDIYSMIKQIIEDVCTKEYLEQLHANIVY